jgi:hypothetical protein
LRHQRRRHHAAGGDTHDAIEVFGKPPVFQAVGDVSKGQRCHVSQHISHRDPAATKWMTGSISAAFSPTNAV